MRERRSKSDMALRLSTYSSWLLPQLTFLCANISWAMVRGGPLSAEDCPDMTLASSSNRRLSLTVVRRQGHLGVGGHDDARARPRHDGLHLSKLRGKSGSTRTCRGKKESSWASVVVVGGVLSVAWGQKVVQEIPLSKK